MAIEIIQDRIGGGKGKAFLPPELIVQAGQISREDATGLGQQRPDAFIESQLAFRHWPIRDALIQEHGAQPDQPRMDDLVHRACRRGLLLTCNRTGETGGEQRMQRRLAEVLG